jgi:hypothetical protein
MAENLNIKKFVRQILGCTCPDKVFEQIEDRRSVSSASPHTRSITIGGRLLIYIWEVDEAEHFKKNFLAMLAAGRKERDEHGLNRFRAVLAVDEMPHGIAAEADLYFSLFAGRDDRMHLHVIPSSLLQNL